MGKLGIFALVMTAILGFALPAGAQPVKVSSLLITGAFRTGEPAVRSMLTVREGSEYPDEASLEWALACSKARMEQTGEYGFIEMITDTSEDGSTDLIVSVAENFMSPVGPFTLFPNVPAYGLSLGFLMNESIQSAALGVLLPYPFGTALAVGHRFYGETSGVTGKLWIEWKPIPELDFAIMQDAGYALGQGLARQWDVTSGARMTIDLSWLANTFGLGFSLWGEGRKGWYQYAFMSGEATLETVLRPFPILVLKASANAYVSLGDYPPYDDARSRLKARLDSAPIVFPMGPTEASTRVDLILGKLFDLSFIPLKPGISVYGFGAAGSVLPALSSFSPKGLSFAAGGGLEIALLPPVSLLFRVGWSHALTENQGAVFFTITSNYP
jgi:hypothetical protein